MTLRSSKVGSLFMGCSRYPDCTATVTYDVLIDTLTVLVKELVTKLLVHERRAKMRIVPDEAPPNAE